MGCGGCSSDHEGMPTEEKCICDKCNCENIKEECKDGKCPKCGCQVKMV